MGVPSRLMRPMRVALKFRGHPVHEHKYCTGESVFHGKISFAALELARALELHGRIFYYIESERLQVSATLRGGERETERILRESRISISHKREKVSQGAGSKWKNEGKQVPTLLTLCKQQKWKMSKRWRDMYERSNLARTFNKA